MPTNVRSYVGWGFKTQMQYLRVLETVKGCAHTVKAAHVFCPACGVKAARAVMAPLSGLNWAAETFAGKFQLYKGPDRGLLTNVFIGDFCGLAASAYAPNECVKRPVVEEDPALRDAIPRDVAKNGKFGIWHFITNHEPLC